jgi:hypothetical protein
MLPLHGLGLNAEGDSQHKCALGHTIPLLRKLARVTLWRGVCAPAELNLLNLEGLPLTDKAFEKMEERMTSRQQLRLNKGVPHPTGLAVVVGE